MARKKKPTEERLALIKAANDAINAVADDKSVSIEQAIVDLQEIAFTADCCIDGLSDDLKNKEKKNG